MITALVLIDTNVDIDIEYDLKLPKLNANYHITHISQIIHKWSLLKEIQK